MSARRLEIEDIQGNILGGFNTDVQVFISLSAPTEAALRAAATWAAGLADEVTTVLKVRQQRDSMKMLSVDAKLTWLCVAVSQRLLKSTQPDLYFRDEAFNGGMLGRAPSILGDRTDSQLWTVGKKTEPVDVLLIVASNRDVDAQDRAASLVASALQAGLTLSYQETCRRLPGEKEHFGFRDGLSQPLLLDYDTGGTLGVGNFVFGYSALPDGDPVVPYIDERKVADNGSLLVFRRLEQDVGAFTIFCQLEATRLSAKWPQLSAPHLQALLVGRWPSGALASVDHAQDPGDGSVGNDFDFSQDPTGLKCPAGAHIRKVNPRNGQRDRVDVPRIIRRGIPFGRPAAEDPGDKRGLNFVAFQTSIRDQFEFITQHWMNSREKPAKGQDLLVGRDLTSRSLTITGPQGEVTVSANLQQWIVPTGGAYLFAPGRAGLRKLGLASSSLGFWKIKAFSVKVFDGAQALLST